MCLFTSFHVELNKTATGQYTTVAVTTVEINYLPDTNLMHKMSLFT